MFPNNNYVLVGRQLEAPRTIGQMLRGDEQRNQRKPIPDGSSPKPSREFPIGTRKVWNQICESDTSLQQPSSEQARRHFPCSMAFCVLARHGRVMCCMGLWLMVGLPSNCVVPCPTPFKKQLERMETTNLGPTVLPSCSRHAKPAGMCFSVSGRHITPKGRCRSLENGPKVPCKQNTCQFHQHPWSSLWSTRGRLPKGDTCAKGLRCKLRLLWFSFTSLAQRFVNTHCIQWVVVSGVTMFPSEAVHVVKTLYRACRPVRILKGQNGVPQNLSFDLALRVDSAWIHMAPPGVVVNVDVFQRSGSGYSFILPLLGVLDCF